jgi:exodeoxyribonuclease-5
MYHFQYEPTHSQLTAIDGITDFLTTYLSKPVFLLKGYAGTGKTTLVASFVKMLDEIGLKSVLLAPTGRAAKVLSGMAGKPAFTIHKKIYRQTSSKDGFGGFNLNKNMLKDAIFIVDEASMIANDLYGSSLFGSGRLLDDLLQFVFDAPNCRLMLIGDTAQLPPVGLSISPALESLTFEGYGFSFSQVELTDVVRQEQQSGILINATMLRELLGSQQTINHYPIFSLAGFSDIIRLSGAGLMEELQNCYDRFGLEETLVVCRTNKRANMYNKGIRASILYCDDELSQGDYLLVMKNNYHWLKGNEEVSFIANGDIAKVSRIKKHYELYGYRFVDITCQLVDYKEMEIDMRINLDSIATDGAGFSATEQESFLKKVLEDYTDIPSVKKQYEAARENDFYNALQIKFAYAMTCHKAQGGQWKAVFVDLGYFTEEYLSHELVRWLYTAVTRATERLYFVNFPKEFYGERSVVAH